MNHAASRATAIHIAWKYLFMSKATSLTCIRFGIANSATAQAPRKALAFRSRTNRAPMASINGTPRLVR